eukprot:TRINITY_DN567_c0_g1_i1.p1 TRINITY_DN567_c0_g1~~TRINITY_DN567_c0_g1_i1.p1  ORF type:complete len:351 (-),score=76.26 TRINITY_DN567_c0_g1_i1:51-1103(-)
MSKTGPGSINEEYDKAFGEDLLDKAVEKKRQASAKQADERRLRDQKKRQTAGITTTEPEPKQAQIPTSTYPGKFDDHNKEASSIFEPKEAFEGGMIEWKHQIYATDKKNLFQLDHSFTFGSSSKPASYSVAAVLNRNGHNFLGQWSTNGRIFGHYTYTGWRGWSAEFLRQSTRAINASGNVVRFGLTRKGLDYVVGGEIFSNGKKGLSYFQSLTTNLSAGLSLNLEPQGSVIIAAFRYIKPASWILSGSVIPEVNNLELSFIQKLKRRSCLWGTRLVMAKPPGSPLNTVVSVGWDYNLTVGSVKASVSTDGKMNCIISDKGFGNLMLALSVDCDYAKDVYKVGVGGTVFF